jgi:hypothetical protein
MLLEGDRGLAQQKQSIRPGVSSTSRCFFGVVMNKLLRIIFSVLKNKQAFRLISPDRQVEMYQKQLKKAA